MWLETILGLILIWMLWQACKKPPGLPPGLWGFPLIGYLSFPPVPTDDKLKEMRKKFGDVFIWRIGTSLHLFLCTYDLCKEIGYKTEFADRPSWEMFTFMAKGENAGIVGSNGLVWQNGRRFAMRHLRDLGMGKSSMVDAIQLEAREMAKEFEVTASSPTHMGRFMNITVLNVIWQLVASRRYDLHDKRIMEFQRMVMETQEGLALITIPDLFSWIRKIFPSWVQGKVFRHDRINSMRNGIGKFIKEVIEDHMKTLDPSNPRDYIDEYLVEMEAQKDNPESTFREDTLDLVASVWDLFAAGSETVAATIRWLMIYMAKYPEVQKKIQKEIDDVTPRDKQPTLEDKARLPYLEATIHELHRMVSFADVGVQHCATQDTILAGYKIPKGTLVYPMILFCHYDSKYWDRPQEFRPERFLNQEGKFVTRREGFMPFGIGRRQCLGEALARMELFIFSTTLLQKFSVSPAPEGVDLAPSDFPFLHLPKDQRLVFTLRE